MLEQLKDVDKFRRYLLRRIVDPHNVRIMPLTFDDIASAPQFRDERPVRYNVGELTENIENFGRGVLKSPILFNEISLEPIDFDHIEKYRNMDVFPALLFMCATYLHIFDQGMQFPITFENQLEAKNFMVDELNNYTSHEVFGDTAKQLLQMINW